MSDQFFATGCTIYCMKDGKPELIAIAITEGIAEVIAEALNDDEPTLRDLREYAKEYYARIND